MSRPRLVALLTAAALAVGLAGIVTPVASAALAQVGPIDPDTKFPTYYTDQNGMALAQCLDGLPRCLSSRSALYPPAGEDFYFDATATVGAFTIENSVEGSYLGTGPGSELSFERTGVFAQKGPLPASTTYTVTDPYGPMTCVTDKTGVIKKNGCRTETPTAVGDFTSTLTGRIGPYLTWDTYGAPTGAPPAGFIGDGVTPHKVTGSPTGFNKARVEGPGVNTTGVDACPTVDGPITDCAETDQFAIMGKLQPGPVATVSPSGPLAYGSAPSGTPVTKRLTYSNTGTTPVNVSAVSVSGADAADFTTSDTCRAVPAPGLSPGGSCSVDVTFTPRWGATSTATLSITDDVAPSPRTTPLSGTGQTPDRTPPTVTAKTPAAGALTVSSSMPGVSATFSEPVQGVSSSSFVLATTAGAAVPATVTPPSGGQGMTNTWTLTPTAALANDTRYTVTLTGGPAAIRDLAGNALTNVTWSFLTGPAPTVTGTTPAAGATGVRANSSLTATFSEPVTGVDNSTFTLTYTAGGIVLPGTVTRNGGGTGASASWTLKPNQTLGSRATYTATLTGGVKDVAGNPQAPVSWTFTTG